MTDPQIDEIEHSRMSLGDHIAELRTRLFRGALAVLIAFCVGYSFSTPIVEVVLRPLNLCMEMLVEQEQQRCEGLLAADPELERWEFFEPTAAGGERLVWSPVGDMVYRSSHTGFFFVFKIVIFFAIVVGSPILLWELWQFIAAGLYKRERRMLLRYFPAAVSLLIAGILFGYFLVLPYAQFFLASMVDPRLKAKFLPELSDYLSLATMMTIVLGAIFQLPILMHALVKLDLVKRDVLVKHRPHFVVGSFVVAALLTPPDPFTQAMLAIPMALLYELGLFWTRFIRTPEALVEPEAAEAPEAHA